MRAQGTIVGEGVSLAQPSQGLSLAQHSQSTCSSSSRHPLAALSFPDNTALRTHDESMRSSTRPSWSIYQSPEKEPTLPATDTDAPLDQDRVDVLLPKRSFHRRKSGRKPLEENQEVFREQDVLTSPKAAPGLHWLQMNSSTHAAEPDLDVMKSPPVVSWIGHQSPEEAPETDFLWETIPEPVGQNSDVLSAQGEVDLLLPKKSFQRRKSGVRALQALHESLLMSPKQALKPSQEEPGSPEPAPGLDWFCVDSPQQPSEPDLDVMTSPPQSCRTPDAPMSPMDTSRAGTQPVQIDLTYGFIMHCSQRLCRVSCEVLTVCLFLQSVSSRCLTPGTRSCSCLCCPACSPLSPPTTTSPSGAVACPPSHPK